MVERRPDEGPARDDVVGSEQREGGERTEPTGGRAATPMTQQVGRVAVVAIVVLFGVFAVANSHFVDFSWVFGGTEVVEADGERLGGGVPLIVLLIVSFVLGALVGGLVGWRRRRRRRAAGPTEAGT